jgi:aminoglycoside 6'-N-acetyltransferase
MSAEPDAEVAPVTLEPVAWERHGALLADWLHRPHVSRWWEADQLDRMRATPERAHAMIAVRGTPVGYIRWQAAGREALEAAGLRELPPEAIDIDLFVGEAPWLGRGVGPSALRLLLHRLARERAAPLACLCTSTDNVAALRAFEKAGFRRLRQFDDTTGERCWVLVAELA